MKFALVNGQKTEAFKGGRGFCPSCSALLIAKCGEFKTHHWAHKGNRICDQWWENETEWHRAWKRHFPKEWQEVVQFDEKGEKHIADVKTETGLVLEFQHSYLNPEERRSRNTFYPKIAWVVDGTRRTKDKSRFIKVIQEGSTLPLKNIRISYTDFPEESRILKEWVNCDMPVFFDFGEQERLWFLIPKSTMDRAYVVRIARDYFIDICVNGSLEEVTGNITLLIYEYQNYVRKRNQMALNRRANQMLAKKRTKYRRRRF
ncbi:competence protein CoiA family protein [Muricauda sp. 334s03]|uniref:Competence protein CoiA family protein n=1 Tax=Flagellimonas yonaguniensis TaxID=3031325 RepID=A0ABT5Y0J6_9FLAO|nr:competence protein CoiA family protein [[Muricauda] yonaguniensis]MDF0716957.1 competence protein CoiA family protein [[Muricauda] yonaguniensis]